MMQITDIHTHAFPDALAERAMHKLVSEVKEKTVTAYLDGKISSLIKSMDSAGIQRSVICSIATKPDQFEPILKWSNIIASGRIIPMPSIHPRDNDALQRLNRIKEAGFKGIKLHPYYQDFVLDEETLLPIYERLVDLDLLLICHTGFDIAFPRIRRCDPEKIAKLSKMFPKLKLVATHLGAWMDWENVKRYLLEQPIYMEISYALGHLPDAEARAMLLAHPAEYLLFGSDSPWQDQAETIRHLKALDLGEEREAAILSENAARLLDVPSDG